MSVLSAVQGSLETSIIARRGLVAPPPPPPNVAAVYQSGGGALQGQVAARTIGGVIARIATPPPNGGGNVGGAVVLPDQGTPPGVGGPVSPSAGAPTLASLSPTVRTIAKVAPFVAAVFFWQKGDHVLAGVSAAAGALAFVAL